MIFHLDLRGLANPQLGTSVATEVADRNSQQKTCPELPPEAQLQPTLPPAGRCPHCGREMPP